MKISVLLLVVCTIHITANVYAQKKHFDLSMNNVTLKEVLKSIENQSDFRFFYNDELTDINRLVTINVTEMKIDDILTMLFSKTDVSYKALENNLIILAPNIYTVQQQQVSGRVVDENTGEPLVGVTIQVQGTMTGTVSEADGTFRINIPQGANTLIFRFVGYQTQQVDIYGKTSIDIVMAEEITALEEVVVTGYAVERKKDIIGSISIVNTKEMLSTPSGNLANQLQGKAAGVTISSSGDPGGISRVRVRGFSSFTNSDPLYIIDGVPGDIGRLNPNDVESVQILKDAASSSIYGARAASGVVIITTAHGKEGKIKLTVDSYTGMSYISKNDFPEMCNAQEWGELYWKGMEGAGISYGDPTWYHPQYGDGPNPVIPEYILVNNNGTRIGGTELEKLKINNTALFNSLVDPANYDFENHQIVKAGETDWLDETFNPAPIQNLQITVSGGTDKSTFLFSLNYYDETSTASKYSYFKRYSARTNSSFSITDNIRIGENIQIGYSKSRDVSSVSDALWFHPLIPVYDIAGNPASSAAPGLVSWGQGGRNPVTGPKENKNDGINQYWIFGNTFLEIDLFKGLTLRSSLGVDFNQNEDKDFTPISFEHYENTVANNLSMSQTNFNSLIWTNTATYSKTIKNHVFKLIIGTEAVSENSKSMGATTYDYTYALQQDPDFQVLDAGTGIKTNSGTFVKSNLLSQFGRLDYGFADKYLLNATIRRDGSSKFGENNRYGVFPSFAVGWRVSGESFMQSFKWLTDMKLRASYGIIGNQNGLSPINQYNTYSGSDLYSYAFSGSQISVPYFASTKGNPDAKWEKTVTTDFGIDLSFLQGKISFTGDYYNRLTKDLLVPNQAPLTGSIATQPSVNVGSMRNRGVDMGLTVRGNLVRELKYEVTLGFTKYKNSVLKVLDNEAATIITGLNNVTGICRTEKGYPIAYYYGYIIDGFFNTQDEVDEYNSRVSTTWIPPSVGGWRIKDVNGDNIINDFDRTYMGSAQPDFQASLNFSLNYRNFDFLVSAFWNQGGELVNVPRSRIDFFHANWNRSKRMLTDSWTPDNHNAKLPKLNVNDAYSNKYYSSYLVEDATYFRLKTVQFGYTLPSKWLAKFGIENLRLYVQSQNPLTFKKSTVIDPDAVFSGFKGGLSTPLGVNAVDLVNGIVGTVNGNAPTPKQVIFGINLSL